MRYAVNSKEMKRYDANTTEHFGIPSLVLMERAAVSFTETIFAMQLPLDRVLIVCGGGNNGGDGIAIGRILALRGVSVDLVLASDGKKVSAENKKQQEIAAAYQIPLLSDIPENRTYTLIVDAVFGVGLSRPLTGAYLSLIQKLNQMSGTKVAVDISSGISSDDGSVLGDAFLADHTITFSYEKIGQLLWPGNTYSGRVIVQKIGIDDRSFQEKEPAVRLLEESDLRAGLPRRVDHSNKGTYGRLLFVAGSVNMAGAAILAAKAAYAAGVGLVRIVTPEENRVILQTAVPEAILTTYVDKTWNPDSFAESLSWADAIVCGPGLGLSDIAKCMVEHVLSDADVPVLFDADALNLLATEVSLLERPHGDLVVTPHLKEMSRLSGHAVDYLQGNLIASAMEFACQYNVTCVLKDARTVTAVPYRNVYLNLSGNHGMAVGGSGDVLSGVIGSLLAQGMNAEEASAYGVYLHGSSGDLIREETGARAMTASDLIDGLRAESASLEQE